MKKHVLALLLAVALIVSMIPTVAMAADEPVNPYKSAALTLTGKPTLVLKYEPKEGDSAETFTTKFDINNSEPVVAKENNGLYIFEIPVTAARLYSPVKATLFNGETEVGNCEFVLTEYAEKVKEADPAASDLLDSLIAYSNYAAAYNGTTGTKEIKAVQAITALSDYNSVVIENSVSGIGVIPVLNDACDLYFTFPESITGYTVKVNNEVVEPELTEGVLDTTKPYYYAIKEILPQNWADAFVVEVYEGETLKTQFSYSVLSYVQRKLGSEDAKLANLLKAMYIYHRDAEMYARTTAREAAENFENLNAWTLPTAEGTTAPTINANGQMEFNVTTGVDGNYVSKEISSSTNVNSGTTVIDLDFKVTNTGGAEICVMNGSNYVIRAIINHNQLRHRQGSSNTVVANETTNGFYMTLSDMHHARIVLDMTHQVYDLHIDGIKWITGAKVCTSFGNANGLSLRMGVFGTGTGKICFDNVKVSKLAPSAVDLTTVGLKKVLYTNTFDADLQSEWGTSDAKVVDGKYMLSPENASVSVLLNYGKIDSAGLTGKFVFEFDVDSSFYTGYNKNATTNKNTGKGVWIKLSNNAEESVYLEINNNKVVYGTSVNGTQVQKYLGPNSVYRVKFIVDMDACSYDVYINDNTVATGVTFTSVNNIQKIRIGSLGNNAGWSIKIDNLKISQILTAE